MADGLRRMISTPSNSIREALGGIQIRIFPKHRLNQRLAQVFDAAQQTKKELDSFSNQLKEKKETIPKEIWNTLNAQRADLTSRYRLLMDTIVEIGEGKPHRRVARAWFAPSTKKRCQLLHSDIRDIRHTLTELITRLTILSATEKIKFELKRLIPQHSPPPHKHRELRHDDDSVSMYSTKIATERLRSSLHDLFNYRNQITSDSEHNPASPASSQEKFLKSNSNNFSSSSPHHDPCTSSTSTSSILIQSQQQEQKNDRCFCSRLVHPITSQVMFDNTKPDSIECHTKTAALLASHHGGCFLALQGLPGTGKSTLLHALKHDNDITSNFTGGVYWLPLRSGVADIGHAINCIADLVSMIGFKEEAEDLREMSDIHDVVERASAHLSTKRTLLLLDKSWTAGDVGSSLVFKLKPFVSSRTGTVVVFISEDSEAIWDARRISITPREALGEETLYIFLNHAGFTREELAKPETVELLRFLLLQCYGLPLAMTIAGKTIANATKYGMTRKEAMMLYLEHHEGVLDGSQMDIPCINDIIADHVHAALQILYLTCENSLPSSLAFRDLFLAFSVVDKGHNIPLETLRYLWNLSPGMTRTVASLFDATGLATMLMKQQESVDELQIHDLLHDYVCTELTPAEFTKYHSKLVESYRDTICTGEPPVSDDFPEWWNLSIPDGGYYNRNLTRHLYHAGHRIEMLKVVVHPKWILKQINEVGVDQVENDIGFVTDFMTFNHSNDAQALQMTVEDFEEIGAAARAAVLSARKNSQELAFHFHERLLAVSKAQGTSSLTSYIRYVETELKEQWVQPVQSSLVSRKDQLCTTIRILSQPRCMVSLAGDNYIACGCNDGRIIMFDTIRRRIVGQWKGHTDAVTSMCRSHSGKVIVTSSSDMTIKAWDCASSAQIGEIAIADHRCVSSVAVTVDELFIIGGFSDGSLLVWGLENGDRVAEVFNASSPSAFTKIDALPGGDGIMTSSANGFIRKWKLETMVKTHEEVALHLTEDKNWSPDPLPSGVDYFTCHYESQILASTSNGFIYLTDLCDGKPKSLYDTAGRFGRITTLRFSKNGKYLVFGSSGSVVHVLDVGKNKLLGNPLLGHREGVCAVTFLCRGKKVVSAGGDETLKIWNIENLGGASSPPAHSGTQDSLALTDS
ncbi:unnamed protein product [Agarophyton chilense]